MITHLLVDLDDTLLKNSMEEFAPPYYKALSAHLNEIIPPGKMLKYLFAGTQAMMNNSNHETTLEHAFDNVFYPGVGIIKQNLHPHIEIFYDKVFPSLKKYTEVIPDAVKMVEDALSRGLKLVIATNPLFPRKAIIHRLRWAGLDPDRIPFSLITSYETFHFTKPNPAYFQEILATIGVGPENCVMVGNDLEMDINPAKKIGIKTFFLDGSCQSDGGNREDGRGQHNQVIPWIDRLI